MKSGFFKSEVKEFPEPSIRRLPIYRHYLKQVKKQGTEFTSATQIAHNLDLLPVQVRKDLKITGIEGKPKIGYEVSPLLLAIEKFLGWNEMSQAVLAGVGHLGSAILGYHGFKEYGLNISAAFDNDFSKIGKLIRATPVFSTDSLEKYIREHKIEIGIVTVPAQSAQNIADIMVDAGIKAVWNFAPEKITSSNENVIIQHENLASSFAALSKKINENKKDKA
ncbi:MAG: redox-sensing transcriptional repressor Rex [Endomicrobium sp.]|jgi:redox-sensing transcriptional repressor|nr:redox-sensing transcriptional repressor Rex [Endomicrobium sp.]